MIDILFIIFLSGIVTLIITYVKKYYNNKNIQEREPVENYDLFKPTKTKIKKQKLKTKK
jgi:hypothetical protein